MDMKKPKHLIKIEKQSINKKQNTFFDLIAFSMLTN